MKPAPPVTRTVSGVMASAAGTGHGGDIGVGHVVRECNGERDDGFRASAGGRSELGTAPVRGGDGRDNTESQTGAVANSCFRGPAEAVEGGAAKLRIHPWTGVGDPELDPAAAHHRGE